MNDWELQTIRMALAELQGFAKTPTAPLVSRKIHIASVLLANAIARNGQPNHFSSIDEELAVMGTIQQEEERLLALYGAPEHDEHLSATNLTSYLRKHIGHDVSVIAVNPLVGGASKQTIILKLEGADEFNNALVLRRDTIGGPVELKAADEYPITKKVYERGIPVAEPLWADHNPPFGGTCIVTKMMPGEAAFDFTVTTGSENARESALAMARILGAIHALAVSTLDLPDEIVSRSSTGQVEFMLDHYEAQWKRRQVEESPTIAEALKWLRANIPTVGEVCLVHGDASLRNLLMHNGRESAMLDWELWHIGDHHEDLAYCLVDIEPRISWDEFITEYLAHGGKPFNAASMPFWQMFGAVRNMIFAANLAHSYVVMAQPQATMIYSAIIGGRPLTRMVAEQLRQLKKTE